jgi:6-phosphogluconolactonase/glucosamine-6-phosphate isomerase/deaminase
MILGMGMNGHLALNDPGTPDLPASVLKTVPDAQFWYA